MEWLADMSFMGVRQCTQAAQRYRETAAMAFDTRCVPGSSGLHLMKWNKNNALADTHKDRVT